MRCFKVLLMPLILLLSGCGSPPKSIPLDNKVNEISNAPLGASSNPITLNLNRAIYQISTNDPLYYVVDVPAGKSSLVVSFAWGKDYKKLGNPNIYIRHQNAATTEVYDCRSEWKAGDSEVCILDKPKAGQYYILVNPVKSEHKEGEEGKKVESETAKDKVEPNEFTVNDGILFATTDLFNVSYACENAEADIRAQTLTDKQRKFVCQRLAMTQERFKAAWRSIDPDIVTPIDKDLNSRVVAELFSSMKSFTTWMSYLQDSSNNSGVFHEESPEDPKSPRAAFRTFNGIHWTSGLTHYWNLEHEFSHYLDGRYLKKGNYSTTSNHNVSWWSEGLAQYFGFWNGPERLFANAHSTLYPDNILACSTPLTAYSDSRTTDIVEEFSIVNQSNSPLILYRVDHKKGTLSSKDQAITLAPNERLDNFTAEQWHAGDRFVLQNEHDSCVAYASLKNNQTLVFKNQRLSTTDKMRTLADTFQKKANAYTWGHLAFTFFFEEQHAELKKFVALIKAGQYDESDALLDKWATIYEADFQAWLNWGTKKAFIDSFALEESQLALNSYTTLYGAGDWGFRLQLSQDVDSLTIGSGGGSGKYDLLIGKDKPVHSVANLNAEALICQTSETTNRPNQQCIIENAKAGNYYITVDNETAVTVLADTHLYACAGKDCHITFTLPATPDAEKVAVMKIPRIVDSADISGDDLLQPYELQRSENNQAENFHITNNSATAIILQRIDEVTGKKRGTKSGETISLAAGETWIPETLLYQQERIAVTNKNGAYLGTLTAKSAVHLGYFDRSAIVAKSCNLKESYTRGKVKASNASVRNESNKTLYAFWVFPDQMANKKTNGLLRRKSYASLAPGETWDNITWRHGDRIMLGTTDNTDSTECVAIFEVDSDKHYAVQN
ncbi:MAG: collagenase [Colwellia sp.]|nr:collagenase [Colwellia sp.]